MAELVEIKADIKITKEKLTQAEKDKDRDMILAYANLLSDQQKKENILLAGAGDFIF